MGLLLMRTDLVPLGVAGLIGCAVATWAWMRRKPGLVAWLAIGMLLGTLDLVRAGWIAAQDFKPWTQSGLVITATVAEADWRRHGAMLVLEDVRAERLGALSGRVRVYSPVRVAEGARIRGRARLHR
ncbi:MAG: hypothetical protein D6771_00425, partial [Zetaproteobacteria bacterium]